MTTDTALLVSKEILQDKKDIKELIFLDEPEIPIDDGVVRFMDERVGSVENVKNIEREELRLDKLKENEK